MQGTAVQTWDLSSGKSTAWYVRLLPSLTDFAFILPIFLLFGMLPGAKMLLGDGDTGWHIRTGEWILQHKMVPTVDFFSFTKAGQPWFAWEWGWDVLFAIVHRSWGLAGVVFINVLLLGFVSVLLFRLIRRCCGDDILAFLFTVLVTCGCTVHWWARPHLFSWVFVLLFTHIILSAKEGSRKALWLLPLLTILWTNIHGGFFLGILMLLVTAIGEALTAITEGGNIWQVAYVRSKPYLISALACASATFINPYTWHLHQHIYHYLQSSKLLDNIGEYQSPSFHDGPLVFFECMLLLGAASALWCLQSRKFAAAILIVLFAHLALVSVRNVPLFLLIAAPWVACMSKKWLHELKSVPALSRFGVWLSGISGEFRPLERIERAHFVSAAVVLFLAVSFAAGKPGFAAEFDAQRFPAKAIPLIEHTKPSRIFTYDQWGDYLIYRLYPEQLVFMDGRSDFYGYKFLERYQHILSAQYDWEADLKRFAVDMVLIRPDSPLATVLKQSRNWKLLVDDGHLIVFLRATQKYESEPVLRESARFSSVPRNGRNKLEASTGLQVGNSGLRLKLKKGETYE